MRLDVGILRAASVLVPAAERPEWLAEWAGELWAVRQGGGGQPVRFCLGAFRDALWVRRNSPAGARAWLWLKTPGRCLGFLGLWLAAGLLFGFVAPDPQAPLRPPGGVPSWSWAPVFPMLLLASMATPFLPAITSLRMGAYPGGCSWRRRLFFAAKIALLLPAVFVTALDLWPAAGLLLRLYGAIAGYALAFRWALNDQRRRCPECLTLLTCPASIGEPSHTILEWYGTEFACMKGHGLLHVAENPTTSFDAQRWVRLDRSWRTLFSAAAPRG